MGHAAGPKPIGVAIMRTGLTPRPRLGRPRVKWLEPRARPTTQAWQPSTKCP